MTAPADMPSSIPCPACGFENPTTSLYCQDCGARLVRPPSGATPPPMPPPSAPKKTAAPASKARILSTHRTGPGHGMRWLSATCSTLILAALAAFLIQIFRAPAYVPPPITPFTPQVVVNVRNGLLQTARNHSTIDAPWPDLNAYLAAVLPPTEASGAFSVTFQRAMVFYSPGGFTAMVERKLSGSRTYAAVSYQVAPRGNGLALVPTGAALGRLRLPAGAAPLVEWLSGGLGNALSTELEALRDARAVTFAPDKVHVDFSVRQP